MVIQSKQAIGAVSVYGIRHKSGFLWVVFAWQANVDSVPACNVSLYHLSQERLEGR